MLGDSGGRSAGNRVGEGARRRNTPRERAQIDPSWDHVVPRRDPAYTRYFLTATAWTSLVGFMVLLLFVLGEWFSAWNIL